MQLRQGEFGHDPSSDTAMSARRSTDSIKASPHHPYRSQRRRNRGPRPIDQDIVARGTDLLPFEPSDNGPRNGVRNWRKQRARPPVVRRETRCSMSSSSRPSGQRCFANQRDGYRLVPHAAGHSHCGSTASALTLEHHAWTSPELHPDRHRTRRPRANHRREHGLEFGVGLAEIMGESGDSNRLDKGSRKAHIGGVLSRRGCSRHPDACRGQP